MNVSRRFLINKIPIRKPTEADLFEKLVAVACPPKPWRRRVQTAKKCGADIPVCRAEGLAVCPSPQSTDMSVCATFHEELIDTCILELYFPEEALEKDLNFL